MAISVSKELQMIETQEIKRGLDLSLIPPDSDSIQLNKHYRLKVNFQQQLEKFLILINEDEDGNKYLISPLKAYAEVYPTQISGVLYFPPIAPVDREENEEKHAPALSFTA